MLPRGGQKVVYQTISPLKWQTTQGGRIHDWTGLVVHEERGINESRASYQLTAKAW